MSGNISDQQIQKQIEAALSDDDLLAQIYSFASDIQSGNKTPSLDASRQTAAVPLNFSAPLANVVITLRDFDMEASICVYSAETGQKQEPMTLEMIKGEIAKAGVVYGIDWEIIDNMVNNQIFDTIFTFAQGDQKEDGVDGKVTSRFDEVRKLKPKLLEDGSVDFRDLGSVISIHAGTPICDVTPETPGKDGKTVKGVVAAAIPGKKPNIPMGKNTVMNATGTLLIAQKDGNLVFENGKFDVETEYVVKGDVDVSTGNIKFIGDVHIKGSVEQGFIVESEKGIMVEGTVSGATLKAVGDITVKNGAINANLNSTGGNVKVGFGESTYVKCKGKCTASSLVSCNVESENDVDVTIQSGSVVGGNFSIYGNFVCNTLGHRNYIPTNVELGNYSLLVDEKTKLQEAVDRYEKEIEKLDITVNYLKSLRQQGIKLDSDKLQFMNVAVRLKMQKANEKKPLLSRILEIESMMGSLDKMVVRCNKALYPNVKITIGGVMTTVRNEYGHCMAHKDKNEIIIA